MRIAIIGAGIGGLAAAIALRTRGFDPSVYEQAPALGEVGAGVQLSPNATRVLRQWGLLDAIAAVATSPQATVLRHGQSGAVLQRRPLGAEAEARYGAPYYQIHRADLHKILVSALPAESLRLGAKAAAIDAECGAVRFADGASIEADLIVGADGLHSIVRAGLFGDTPADFTGEIAFRGLAPASAWTESEPAGSVWIGQGRHVVSYLVESGRRVNVVAMAPREGWRLESWSCPASHDEMLAEFAGWHADVKALLAAIAQPFKWALYDRAPLTRWSRGRATLLGDAAHPMLPTLAQGAAQAIEDASVLAQALDRKRGDLDAALAAYEAARLPRTARIQLQARKNQELGKLGFKAPPPSTSAYRPDVAGDDLFDWLYGWDATES